MKKIVNRLMCTLLIALLVVGITACNTDTDVPAEGTKESLPTQRLSSELKEKYANEVPFDYLDAVENIGQTEVLRLDVSIDPEKVAFDDINKFVSVYVDKSLSVPLDTKIEYDAESGELLINPPSFAVFSPSEERNKWGYAEIYYVAYFYSPIDGEKLEKPALVPFTVKSDMESPYLEFAKGQDGFASFKWTEVSDAEKYHIYSFAEYEDLNINYVWPVGEDISGTTYTDEFVDQVGSHITTNQFYVPIGEGDEGSMYRYFYVVAEKNGVYSRASNIIDGKQLLHTLPYRIDSSSATTLDAIAPSEVGNLSGFVDVIMADDETVVRYPVTFDIDDLEVVRFGDYINVGDDKELGNTRVMHFTFTVDGTGLSDHTYIKNYDYPEFEDELKAMIALLETQKGKATKGKDTEISRVPNEPEEDLPEKNDVQTTGFNVFATSALSEYLALNMLSGEELVDISDFPEARDSDYLMDAFFEAMYQNPLVMTVNSVALSYDNKSMLVEYGQTKDELQEKQEEVLSEVRRVVQEIITDDMSDFEKEMAINDYLCESAEYDMAALENALENDMYVDASFNDSFTPYGILINKVGVCASYAGSFKLLADEAGLDCVIVTGYLNGNLAHAWNRVNIEDEWMSLDTTNNDNPYLYNYLFNIPDYVSETVLVEDTMYVADAQLTKFKGENENVEYYRMSNNYYTPEDIAKAMVSDLIENGVTTLRTDYDLQPSNLESIFEQIARDSRMTTDVLRQISSYNVYYDLGVISITDQ